MTSCMLISRRTRRGSSLVIAKEFRESAAA
jgi:hypothetical protein